MYYYDDHGWQTQAVLPDRSTSIVPPTPTGGMQPNWTGLTWVLVTYTAPPAPTPAPQAAWAWLIDLGPFFDRFGAAKMAVLISTDATVKAILQDVMIRKYIDLKNTQVSQSLAYIGTVVPSVTGALQTSILTTPVADSENTALRKLYF